jgi:ABC-type multidrug transport system ATPase subunit
MHRPRILFLDEPTAGLDAASRRSLWAYLADIRKGQETTVVLTTHYLEEAEAADRILILNHGQIVAQGSPDQVKAGSESAIQAIPVQSAKAPTRGAEYLEIDAEDRDSLRRELIGLGVHFDENRHFLVYADGRAAYEIVRSIATPLCVMRTRQVSLEDVYLRLIAPSNAED